MSNLQSVSSAEGTSRPVYPQSGISRYQNASGPVSAAHKEDHVVQPNGSAGIGVSPQKVLPSVSCSDDHFHRTEFGHRVNNRRPADHPGDQLVGERKPQFLSQSGSPSKEYDASHATDALPLALTLPQPEVPKFSSDVTQYKVFVTAFDIRVASRTASFADRLYYLDQHLVGEPKDIISSCFYLD